MTMATDPWDDAGAVLQRAAEAQNTGDNEQAYAFYARASELNPDGAQAWRGRAATTTLTEDALVSCAYEAVLTPNDKTLAGELDQRIRSFAAGAEPNSAWALITIGQKLSEVGLIEEAHLLLRRAIELDDTLEEGFVWAAATTNDLNESAVALKRALALNPKDARARAGFSTVMLELGGTGSAPSAEAQPLASVAQAIHLADSAPDLIRAGEQALVAGDRALAYQAFVRATQLGPREEAAWLGRARATGDIDETLTCLEQALAINPDNMQAREARTFYRVRKLREGVRKRQEPSVEPPRFTPTFAGGGGFTDQPTPEVRQRRILLLVIMIVVLIFLILALLLRLQMFG
jgi:tetratricopeptide (TPR) repeat protein